MWGTAAQQHLPTSFLRVSPCNTSVHGPPSSARCPKASSAKDFPPASRIFVRNISYSTNETGLRSLFSDFGQIVEVKLVRDVDTKRSKGYAFVQYSSQEGAILAIEQMDGKIIEGRVVHVELAKPPNNKYAGYPITSGPPPHRN